MTHEEPASPLAVLDSPDRLQLAPRNAGQHIEITPGKMREAYADKIAAGEVNEDQLTRIAWLIALAKTERLSTGGLAKRTGIDAGTLSKVFNALYPAQLDSLCGRIDKFRTLYEARSAISKADFVKTALVKSIWEVCDTALVYQTIYPIWGASQIGKTVALEEYQKAHNHGRTIYVRMPATGHLTAFLKELNRALFENASASGDALRDTPKRRINERNLLIIDELHQTVLGSDGKRRVREGTLEYLRELWDKTHCGMVLCGTNVFSTEAETGKSKAVISQLLRRGFPAMELPDLLPRGDMDEIARAYGLPPADHEVHDQRVTIVQKTGLRAYTNYLKGAARMADKQGKAITWRHFTSAYDILMNLNKKPGGAK